MGDVEDGGLEEDATPDEDIAPTDASPWAAALKRWLILVGICALAALLSLLGGFLLGKRIMRPPVGQTIRRTMGLPTHPGVGAQVRSRLLGFGPVPADWYRLGDE